jgi:hypothetical protein
MENRGWMKLTVKGRGGMAVTALVPACDAPPAVGGVPTAPGMEGKGEGQGGSIAKHSEAGLTVGGCRWRRRLRIRRRQGLSGGRVRTSCKGASRGDARFCLRRNGARRGNPRQAATDGF